MSRQSALQNQPPATTALQRRLAAQIAAFVRSEGLRPGESLNQFALAQRFGVSRTPVRAALGLLERSGMVRFSARGVEVLDTRAAAAPADDIIDPLDRLINQMARDRHIGTLQDEVTEAGLMRRYGCPRPLLAEALRHFSALGMAVRKPGFGWRFLVGAETTEEKAAAYRFRLALEPAALLEPGYAADPRWISGMRRAHERYLARPWRDDFAVSFFEMNAAFHTGLVAFSGNPFFIKATEQQIALRRLRNYSWRVGEDRVRVSCAQHLAILEALADTDVATAAARLRLHLEQTAQAMLPLGDMPAGRRETPGPFQPRRTING